MVVQQQSVFIGRGCAVPALFDSWASDKGSWCWQQLYMKYNVQLTKKNYKNLLISFCSDNIYQELQMHTFQKQENALSKQIVRQLEQWYVKFSHVSDSCT